MSQCMFCGDWRTCAYCKALGGSESEEFMRQVKLVVGKFMEEKMEKMKKTTKQKHIVRFWRQPHWVGTGATIKATVFGVDLWYSISDLAAAYNCDGTNIAAMMDHYSVYPPGAHAVDCETIVERARTRAVNNGDWAIGTLINVYVDAEGLAVSAVGLNEDMHHCGSFVVPDATGAL